MMRPLGQQRRAFTLVELVVVGALIALFSGLAIFGVQQQFRSNTRKAVIGETRQIASALDFAYNDVGFFPKLCYLDDSAEVLRLQAQRAYPGPDVDNFFWAFQHINSITTAPKLRIVQTKWLGPYFSASQSRSRSAQGKGGTRKMVMEDLLEGQPAQGVPAVPVGRIDDVTYDWPLDPYNNPYMIYLLSVDRSDPANPTLYMVGDPNFPNNESPTDTGNFVRGVVSYGPNQVPGGGEFFRPTSGDFEDPEDGGPFGLRLYYNNPNNTDIPLRYIGTTQSAQQRLRRANAWSAEFYLNAGFGAATMALDDADSAAVGITDPGSDDVVFTF